MIEQITVNEFVDVKDIKGMFLYTKSNKIFSYLRIYPFNLDLLTTEDRRNLTNRLAAAFDISLVVGIAAGVLLIISGGKLVSGKSRILF